MALCRYTQGESARWGWIEEGQVSSLADQDVLATLISPHKEGLAALRASRDMGKPTPFPEVESRLLAPIVEGQEVWAAGVTYESSKLARMAESQEAGDFYARVYVAERPELFFKANPRHVVAPGGQVRIRADSAWNVPEPELTALIAANGQILGYTLGNDMSSRDIEGANPLYLPQAKVYRGACALGPVVVPAETLDPQNVAITLTITRNGAAVFTQSTSTARMRRAVADIAQWLFRENDFPQGVFLLTGTGIIPGDDFTLQSGDQITIEAPGIGTLCNAVAR